MNPRMEKLRTCLILATIGFANSVLVTPAFAQLRLTITSGVTDPIPIAIVPFAKAVPVDGGLDVAQVVERDLQSSGRFKAMARTDMVNTPTSATEVDAAAWKQLRVDYVVVGRLVPLPDGQIRVEADLVNALTGLNPFTAKSTVPAANLRKGAHRVADMLYEKIIGVRGAFDTRIA